jgi:hypothetical protein
MSEVNGATLARPGETDSEERPDGESAAKPAPPTLRKRLWSVAKWSLTVLVLAFVAWRAVKLWREGSPGDVELHPGWLSLAGVFYALGWLPSAWFWRATMARMGDKVSWPAAVRAYYVGHLGKYVPGKALVPIIRGQMVASPNVRFRSAVLGVVYDSLVMMGVGAEISIALLAFLIPDDLAKAPALLRAGAAHPAGRWLLENPYVLPLAVLAGVALSLPVVGRLFAFVSHKFAPVQDEGDLVRKIDAVLIGKGFLAFCVAWAAHGLSLWATLRGVGASAELSNLPGWVATVSFSMFAGFVAIFSPGGAGVREGFLIELLRTQPGVDPRQAVAGAFVLRAVGMATEVIVAAALYYGLRTSRGADASRSP